MSKVDEIRAHINDGRTIRRVEVKELLSEYDRLTADVEPIVRAEWIGPTEDERRADPHAGCREWYGPVYACSKCGCTLMGKDRYCPHCGAHMEGGK